MRLFPALSALAGTLFLSAISPALLAEPTALEPLQKKKGVFHVDERWGFKIRPPKKWELMTVRSDEGWIVAKYLCNRSYVWTESGGGWTYDHKPTLEVIAFVEKDAKAEVIKDGDEITVKLQNPFKNYKEYLRGTYSGGGYYFDEEEETKIGDIDVTKYVVKVEKLARGGPKRIVTWVFHTPQVDFAVEMEVLENAYSKLRNDIKRTLKSFKLIPRTESGLPARSTGGPSVTIKDVTDEAKKTPEELREKRKEENRRAHAKARNTLPDGWTIKKMGRFLVISHVDEKYAKRLVAQLDSLLDWLEKNMGYIGPGEYVREPIIRICKDREEEAAFRSGIFIGFGGEIVTNKRIGEGALSFEQRRVKSRLFEIWFHDRDQDLFFALPHWIKYGLDHVIESVVFKGKKVDFRTDGWEKDDLREAVREGKTAPSKDLMRMGREEFREGSWTRRDEAAALVRFFLDGSAEKHAKSKGVFETYMRNYKAVITKIKEEEGDIEDKPPAKPQTEEEEDAAFKADRNVWSEKEARILEEAWNLTFGDWSERDWQSFEKHYKKSAF